MSRLLLAMLLSAGAVAGQPAQPAQNNDVILRAMKDELARARSLRVVGDPPYFIEYTLDDADVYSVNATYGALVAERSSRFRAPRVRIRVGDAKLDNSNHIYSDAYRGSRFDPSQFVIDDNYDVLRLGFWLATDRAYKQALEALARKKASLKNLAASATEQLPDLAPAEPVSLVLSAGRKPLNTALWLKRTKDLSGLCNNYPKVLACEANAGLGSTVSYLVNNEGSEFRFTEHVGTFRVRAAALADDGMVMRDYVEFLSLDLDRMPGDADLRAATDRMLANVTALASAPVLEDYVGPVLFEGAAGPQLLAELLARSLSGGRRPVTDPERPLNLPAGELEGRIGSRILPEWIDVVDHPAEKQFQGSPLLGYYPVDVEGVVPKPLTMIEKGTLKTMYASRQPIPGVPQSNGHARLPGGLGNNSPAAGNLFVKSAQTSTRQQLREKLIELGKQRSKPFVLVIRKMDFPSTAGNDELRRITSGQRSRVISRPLLAYKVYPDGKEELVRGIRFRGMSVRTLRDIIAVSDEMIPFHYLENGAPFVHMDAGGYVAGTSVVGPSLLIDEAELERIPGEMPRPPIVPPPPLTR